MPGARIEKVNHPYISLVVALMSTFAAIGGSGAFWSYLSDKQRMKLESELAAQRHELKMIDLEAQQAATMTLLVNQGAQLKSFKDALESATRGRHKEARAITGSIDIPIAQGARILRGRAAPTEIQVEEKRRAAKKKLDGLEKMMQRYQKR